jgi:hypothetical protein
MPQLSFSDAFGDIGNEAGILLDSYTNGMVGKVFIS